MTGQRAFDPEISSSTSSKHPVAKAPPFLSKKHKRRELFGNAKILRTIGEGIPAGLSIWRENLFGSPWFSPPPTCQKAGSLHGPPTLGSPPQTSTMARTQPPLHHLRHHLLLGHHYHHLRRHCRLLRRPLHSHDRGLHGNSNRYSWRKICCCSWEKTLGKGFLWRTNRIQLCDWNVIRNPWFRTRERFGWEHRSRSRRGRRGLGRGRRDRRLWRWHRRMPLSGRDESSFTAEKDPVWVGGIAGASKEK